MSTNGETLPSPFLHLLFTASAMNHRFVLRQDFIGFKFNSPLLANGGMGIIYVEAISESLSKRDGVAG